MRTPSNSEEAIELFLELRRRGDEVDPAEFAARYPELGVELSLALDGLIALEALTRERDEGPLPDRVGPFRVVREIGRGGMGVVLEAIEEPLGRRVALKVLPHELLSSASARARFRREAELAARLDHAGIATIYGAGGEGERPWIAMRYVEGETLAGAIHRAREESADHSASCVHLSRTATRGREAALAVAACLAKVARALQSAHDLGVVHRDVKPSNIIITPDGAPVLLDFGLALTEETEGRSLTRTGETVGTPAYLTPESLSGEHARPDAQSDVYALGVTLYESLTLRRPFDEPTRIALYRAIMVGASTDLRAMNRSVPRDLAIVVATAMERDRARRYRSAAALAEDLEACVEGRPVAARPVPLHGRALRWVRREPRLAAASAALVLTVIGGLTWVSMVEAAARRAVDQKNQDLTRTNVSLAEAKSVAEANERLAKQRASDVLSLSAIQELKDLETRSDALWPALPDKLAEYDRWIADARVLIEGREADDTRGISAHPSLKDHEAKLLEIRSRARPSSAAQLEAARRANANYPEWEANTSKLEWMRRMLGEVPWPSESDAEEQIARENTPSDAEEMNRIAWTLVGPDAERVIFGDEMKALVLARHAFAAAADDLTRAEVRDTVAWAELRTGHFDEAVEEEERAIDEVVAARRSEFEFSLARLKVEIASWRGEDARAKQRDDARRLSEHIRELDAAMSEARPWEFDDAGDRWWQMQLSQLVTDLRAFTNPKTGLYSSGVSTAHGQGMIARRADAATIAERSVIGVDAKQRWDAAIAEIATNTRYDGLVMTPQIGLSPIGMDPSSHLWEFAHLQSGEAPVRDAKGALTLSESTCIVLVLIPGGTFDMGAQRTDPNAPNYDPQANDLESNVRSVTLDAFLMSKYEMTQGQWLRSVGRNPSHYESSRTIGGRRATLLNPVEQVSWYDCTEVLKRLGLALPTEAQWEYGARAGTSTPWWTGATKESLAGAANLADRHCQLNGGSSDWAYETWLDDGWTIHAPVGTYRANAFGLHDVVGNVWEWCRDGFGSYDLSVRAGDGERLTTENKTRIMRGGSMGDAASRARSANRVDGAPEARDVLLGVRPSRVLASR